MSKRDPNEQAARQVEKITGSQPARGEDLVSSENIVNHEPKAASLTAVSRGQKIKTVPIIHSGKPSAFHHVPNEGDKRRR